MSEKTETHTHDFWSDVVHTVVPLIIPVLLLVYALYSYSWERVAAIGGGFFGGYFALMSYASEYKPKTKVVTSLHLSLVGILVLVALHFSDKKIPAEQCEKIAKDVYAQFQVKNEALKFPGEVETQLKGISMVNFDANRLKTVMLEQSFKQLSEIGDAYCASMKKNEKETEEIIHCILEKNNAFINSDVDAFVSEAQRCLNLTYDLNMYLEVPTPEKLEELLKKHNITKDITVVDVTSPNLPTKPTNGRSLAWFEDPVLYDYHTVKVIRCVLKQEAGIVNRLELIKIN